MTIVTVLDVDNKPKDIAVPSNSLEVIYDLTVDGWVKDWENDEFYPLHRVLRVKGGDNA